MTEEVTQYLWVDSGIFGDGDTFEQAESAALAMLSERPAYEWMWRYIHKSEDPKEMPLESIVDRVMRAMAGQLKLLMDLCRAMPQLW